MPGSKAWAVLEDLGVSSFEGARPLKGTVRVSVNHKGKVKTQLDLFEDQNSSIGMWLHICICACCWGAGAEGLEVMLLEWKSSDSSTRRS